MAYALTSDAFQVCISLTNVVSSRKMQASTNTTMNVIYFGSQNISTVGTLTNKLDQVQSRVSSAGMIAGAVIGSILGSCLLIVIAFFIIFVVIWTKRSVLVKKQQSSLELLNSPASIQSDQELIDTVSPVDENAEQALSIPFDNPTEITESVSQDEDKQVTVATNIQDTFVIEETKAETVEEIVLDFSNNITLHELALKSLEVTSNTTSDEQENIPIQLNA
jgi:hypothetical protein